MVSVGNTWKTNAQIIETSYIKKEKTEPKIENNFTQSSNEKKDNVKCEPIERLRADKMKQEPVEIKSEPDDLKCKSDSTSVSQSKSSSSSKDKRKDQRSERHHCTRCYKRSKIKRTSIGIQCQKDRRNSITSLYKASSSCSSIKKSNADNLKLNLQVKNSKLLDKQSDKYDRSIYVQGLKYKDFIHVEVYPNGGASVVHMYQDEIDSLSSEQLEELAQEFFKVNVLK